MGWSRHLAAFDVSDTLRILLFSVLLSVVLLASNASCDNNIKARIVVGGDHANPPYEFLEKDQPTGFNVDLVKAVAEVMGLNVEIKLGPWNEVRRDVETGKIDMLAGMYYSQERSQRVSFSVPHTIVTPGIFVRTDSQIRSQKDLEGKSIIVQKGDFINDYLIKSKFTSQVIPVDDPLDELTLLLSGKYDAAFMPSRLQGEYFIKKLALNNLRAFNSDLPPLRYCFAVSRQNPELLHELDEGLNIIKLNGKYKKIYDKWFGIYEEKHLWDTLKYFVITIMVILLLLLGMVVWTRSLRNVVRKRTAEIRDANDLLSSVLRAATAYSIIGTDPEGVIKLFNEGSELMLGYKADEVVDKTTPLIFHDKDEIISRASALSIEPGMEVFTGSARRGESETIECTYIHKDGSRLTVSLTIAAMRSEEGRLSGFIGVARDISNEKKMEQQLMQSQKMEAVGTLAGGLAHDFNNLLTGMLGYTSLMLKETDKQHTSFEKLRTIEAHIQSASELTRQLLGFARGGKYQVKPTDLNELVSSTADMFGRTRHELTIIKKFDVDLYAVEVDKSQIEQVLLNIYVNAWQAMPDGGQLILQTGNIEIDESRCQYHGVKVGTYVKLSITDTGLGMDREICSKAFEPFFTTKDKGVGTGLGLASAYGIITNHGGIINVYSEKGKGTTFTIYLPASERSAVISKESDEKLLLPGSETVLLIDDQEIVADVGTEMLTSLGYKVMAARSGKEAIEKYVENKDRIQLVILDMIMPGMSGGETFDRLKEINPDIKVVLSSGYSINGQASAILERGCGGFIQKPFNLMELSSKIREVLEQ